MKTVTWGLQTSVLQDNGDPKTLKTPQAHLDTWVSSCSIHKSSSWGDVPSKSQHTGRLLCCGCYGFWMHVWTRKKLTTFMNVETLCREITPGDTRSDTCQVDTNKKEWGPKRLVSRSSRLHQQGMPAIKLTVMKMIQRKPINRLGKNGPLEVK